MRVYYSHSLNKSKISLPNCSPSTDEINSIILPAHNLVDFYHNTTNHFKAVFVYGSVTVASSIALNILLFPRRRRCRCHRRLLVVCWKFSTSPTSFPSPVCRLAGQRFTLRFLLHGVLGGLATEPSWTPSHPPHTPNPYRPSHPQPLPPLTPHTPSPDPPFLSFFPFFSPPQKQTI